MVWWHPVTSLLSFLVIWIDFVWINPIDFSFQPFNPCSAEQNFLLTLIFQGLNNICLYMYEIIKKLSETQIIAQGLDYWYTFLPSLMFSKYLMTWTSIECSFSLQFKFYVMYSQKISTIRFIPAMLIQVLRGYALDITCYRPPFCFFVFFCHFIPDALRGGVGENHRGT